MLERLTRATPPMLNERDTEQMPQTKMNVKDRKQGESMKTSFVLQDIKVQNNVVHFTNQL